MKILILTVAGKATRFNCERSKPVLKCIYQEEEFPMSILERLVNQGKECDRIIIVGGYLFEELTYYVNLRMSDIKDRIDIVYNPYYEKQGSMYSLYLGINKAEEYQPDEIIFAEGDLIVDHESFRNVIQSKKDVISVNHDLIWAHKSVVVYLDEKEHLHYIYDIDHRLLHFDKDIKAIFNSGQIWKFINTEHLFLLNRLLSDKEKSGTNLVVIQKYLSEKKFNHISCIEIKKWHNCNKISDYRTGMGEVSEN